ncbi:unnamed protein product [Symbiodinium sp. CCMP2592]|nr:unnamed protein product [Symbiodinium sp. CCMP2592]
MLVDECPWALQVTEESDRGSVNANLDRERKTVRLTVTRSSKSLKVSLLLVLQVQLSKWRKWSTLAVNRSVQERKRGRLPVPGRTKLKGRTSLAEILEASPVEIAKVLFQKGFCSEAPAARTCSCQSPKWKLEPLEVLATGAAKCAGRLPLQELSGSSSKLDLSPDDCSLLLGVDGISNAFRVQPALRADRPDERRHRGLEGAAQMSSWYLAVGVDPVLVWLKRLGNRITRKGQGGGGPISVEEMPILAGSVCHTDGAKAYRWLSSPLNDGTLVDAAGLKLSHTCVKHKPPHPEFSKKMRVQVWVGDHYEEQLRVGGTQKIDGFFASFRRVVGRRPFNTVGPSSEEKAPRMEQLMHFHVRLFQLKHWFGGQDMFAVFGKLRQSQRDVGAVTWASMSAFKPPFVNPEPVQRNPVVVRDGVQVLTLD